MKILIIVPDGVGVRNYLYSNFIDYFKEENHEIIIYHKISKSAIKEIKKQKPFLTNFKEIPSFIENGKARVLRESIAYARLLRNKDILNNKTILKFWNPSKKGFKKKTLYFLSEKIGKILSKFYNIIRKADAVFDKQIAKSKATKININNLKNLSPDFVLNLHQRSSITSPIILAAEKLGIKTGTVIFSWDNVPKARLISRYNNYFVWSQLMKDELELLYPEITPKQVKITGTPQFEFYFKKKNYDTKEVFFNKFGLNPLKKTICFSGNDASSPYEAIYLRDICEEVNKIEIEHRPQIIFRRCPVDTSSRFNKVLEDYKDIVFPINPDWRIEKGNEDSFASIYPTYNDNYLLINTVKHSDLVINLGSTMAHDFAVLNKPCLYLNYNPIKQSFYKVEDIFEFQHFKSMKNMNAVGWINAKKEIAENILESLKKPDKIGSDREHWLEKIALSPLELNSKILFENIKKCI